MSKFEEETIINFNEQDEDADADIFTADRKVAKLIKKAGILPYRESKAGGKVCGWFFKGSKMGGDTKAGKTDNKNRRQ